VPQEKLKQLISIREIRIVYYGGGIILAHKNFPKISKIVIAYSPRNNKIISVKILLKNQTKTFLK